MWRVGSKWTIRIVTAGGVSVLLGGACWFVLDSGPIRTPVRLHGHAAESDDESPFGIAEHRQPPRPKDEAVAMAPLPQASLASTIEQLKATGDPRDAYQAFRLMSGCVRARELDEQTKSLPPAQFAAERRAYGDGQQRIRNACQDITSAQVASRLTLIEKAAEAGVPGAVTARIGEGPFGDRTALDQRPDDPLVTQWVEEAIASVKAAARRDDVEAIVQLGLLSLNWELDETERLQALMDYAAGRDLRDSNGGLIAMSRRAPRAHDDETTASPFGGVATGRE